jgi:hypothetical protein
MILVEDNEVTTKIKLEMILAQNDGVTTFI